MKLFALHISYSTNLRFIHSFFGPDPKHWNKYIGSPSYSLFLRPSLPLWIRHICSMAGRLLLTSVFVWHRFDIDSGSSSSPEAVYITVSANKQKLLFEMLPGSSTPPLQQPSFKALCGKFRNFLNPCEILRMPHLFFSKMLRKCRSQ